MKTALLGLAASVVIFAAYPAWTTVPSAVTARGPMSQIKALGTQCHVDKQPCDAEHPCCPGYFCRKGRGICYQMVG
jgi:hypothetical protein